MFLNKLKYDFIAAMRNRSLIGWLILFPIGLAMAFKIGFGNIYDNEVKFSTIKVAIVENKSSIALHTVTDEFAKEDEPFMTAVYTDEQTALDMLEKDEVKGVIYADDVLSLTVMKEGLDQSIIKTFIDEFNSQSQIITEAIKADPSKAQSIISQLGESVSTVEREPLTEGDPNVYLQFFYNLIAMVGVCGTITGIQMNCSEMPKLTSLGARKSTAGMSASKQSVSNFIAACAAQCICVIVAVTFIHFVLGIDLGDKLPLVYLTGMIGSAAGIAIGTFISTVVHLPLQPLTNITWAGTMGLCFLSGLMVAEMKSTMQEKAPIINDINPAALITDSLYCLNMYTGYDRYIPKILTLAAIAVFFALLTAVFSRRKSYASI